jgi:hypothetical protein
MDVAEFIAKNKASVQFKPTANNLNMTVPRKNENARNIIKHDQKNSF